MCLFCFSSFRKYAVALLVLLSTNGFVCSCYCIMLVCVLLFVLPCVWFVIDVFVFLVLDVVLCVVIVMVVVLVCVVC